MDFAEAPVPIIGDPRGEDRVGYDRVDPARLGQLERFVDAPILMVGLDQVLHVDQVPRMGPTADQIAAENHSAELHVADGRLGDLFVEVL